MSDIKEEQPTEKTEKEQLAVKRQTFMEKMLSMTPYFPQIVTGIVLLFAIGGTGLLISGISHNQTQNGSEDYSAVFARGLITTLFAVITVTMALILILSAMFSSATDFEKRFVMGKEILTIFIGILGTIVGFYFGSAPIDNGKITPTTQEQSKKSDKTLIPTVFLQIYDETQREPAKQIQTKLRESNFIVPGIENVGDNNGSKANPIKQSLVKYYNDADKTNAENIQKILGEGFSLQKGSTKLKVEVGTIEVWFKTPETGGQNG
jgi:hypothetical protein